jgi:hypothetical protein
LDEDWLQPLVAPFDDPKVAATFSRQLPRPGCFPLAARDTEATYGDGSRQAAWRQCGKLSRSTRPWLTPKTSHGPGR